MNGLKVFILVRGCTEIATKSTTIYKQISSYFDVNIIIKGPRTSFQSSELIKKNVLEMFIKIHITLWPSFYPLKKTFGGHHCTHVYQKSQSYDIYILRYGVQQS